MNKTFKLVYIPPRCEVIKSESENFICGVSVRPNSNASVELGYYGEAEHEGGTIGFGNSSTVAPAKGTQWDDEDE
jgi:hypothetical protein